MSNPKVQRKRIRLDYPVQLPDRELCEVQMRRMTVKDMLDSPVKGASDMEGEVRLMARLCDLLPDDLYGMDFSDYAKLQEALLSFRRGAPDAEAGHGAGLSSSGAAGEDEPA